MQNLFYLYKDVGLFIISFNYEYYDIKAATVANRE